MGGNIVKAVVGRSGLLQRVTLVGRKWARPNGFVIALIPSCLTPPRSLASSESGRGILGHGSRGKFECFGGRQTATIVVLEAE